MKRVDTLTLAEDPRLPRQLYVFQLLPSVDVECLSAIFERDTVESLAVYDDARKTDGLGRVCSTYSRTPVAGAKLL